MNYRKISLKRELKDILSPLTRNILNLYKMKKYSKIIGDIGHDILHTFWYSYNSPDIVYILKEKPLSEFLHICDVVEKKLNIKFKKNFDTIGDSLTYFEAIAQKKSIHIRIRLKNAKGCELKYEEKTVKVPVLSKECEEVLNMK